MTIDLKQIISDTLMRLKETIEELDQQMPLAPNAETAAALKCTQLGALVAGIQAVFMNASHATRALILDSAQKCFYLDADVQTSLDRMKAVGVKHKISAGADVLLANIERGSQIAIASIQELDSDDVATISQQIGAMLGLIEGVAHLGGFDASLYEAKERAKDAIVNYGHSAVTSAFLSNIDKSQVN